MVLGVVAQGAVALRKRQNLGQRIVLHPILELARLVSSVVPDLEGGHDYNPDLKWLWHRAHDAGQAEP
jgi:hypothetical protein